MKKLAIILITALIISCKKEQAEPSLRGVWVEKTLRQDTLDIGNPLASDPQSIYLKSQQSFTGYFYRTKPDSILIQRFGSFGAFSAYHFNFDNSKQFTISNFFQRPALPAIIQFEKLQ